MRALGALLRVDWESYCDLMAITMTGWQDPEQTRELSAWLASNSAHEEVLAYAAATRGFDVTDLAGEIKVPTFVVNPNFMPVPSADMARAMVARIRDSRLLLYGLNEALDMLEEEGLGRVFARHDRLAEATRRAVRAWGLEILCAVPEEYSSALTAVMVPAGHDADHLRKVILDAYDMSLGTGLGKVAGRVFRIGHLGDFNDLALAGTLGGVEMGLVLAGIPHKQGGVQAALGYLAECAGSGANRKAA